MFLAITRTQGSVHLREPFQMRWCADHELFTKEMLASFRVVLMLLRLFLMMTFNLPNYINFSRWVAHQRMVTFRHISICTWGTCYWYICSDTAMQKTWELDTVTAGHSCTYNNLVCSAKSQTPTHKHGSSLPPIKNGNFRHVNNMFEIEPWLALSPCKSVTRTAAIPVCNQNATALCS